jgi:N-acetylmuramoyl-L-alanine amidase-like protein
MGAIYLTDLANWLREIGLNVREYSGWQNRARSSGGYDALPLCVMWHHTASPQSWDGQKDADYIAIGSDTSPIANLYIQRDGTVWVIAAGATNTNGKGQSMTFSRGTVPNDGMNSRALGVEMGNDGVGELWPSAQVDAMFAVSNACNARFGNQPDDVSTHQYYAPDRKIDPATCNVEGSWVPRSCTNAGSWNVVDVWAECLNRATRKVDDMAVTLYELTDADAVFVGMSSDGVGVEVSWCDDHRAERYRAIPTVTRRPTTIAELQSMLLLGKLPTNDPRHQWSGSEFFEVIG